MADDTVSWFAAVDWGSAQHQACVLDRGGAVVGERAFPHGGAGLAALCDWLVSIAGDAGAVAVAIEVPHGPVVDALLDRGFAVHAINPKQLDRLRDRFSVAGAKDDRRDARVAAAGLRTDPHLFRPVQASDPAVVALREWSRLAEELQRERVRLGNRVRQQLWRYYPQMLELADDVTAEWVLALWTTAPTPAKAARLREASIAKPLRRHRIRRVNAATALGILRRPALQVAAGVTEAAVLHLRSLLVRLRLANAEFCQAEREVDELCAALSRHAAAEPAGPCDAAILRSLPGVGTVTLATLLTEAGDPLRAGTTAALRTLSGVAPVTKPQRQDPRRRHALRRPGPAAPGRVPLGPRSHSARSQEPQPLRRFACAWSLLRPRPARRRRPPARGRLRLAAAADLVRRGSRQASGGVTRIHPSVRPKPASFRPDLPTAERRAPARSRRPRSGPGAPWTARARC
jgi:transposase